MKDFPEGTAVVYCEGSFGNPNGKTAHGLVRRSRRYVVSSVIDSRHAGSDAGSVLDGRFVGIPIVRDLTEAQARDAVTHFVIGLAPDGGKLNGSAREAVLEAIRAGLHVDSGLHDFLSEDQEIASLAAQRHVRIRDVRKPPHRSELHFFSGRKINEVDCLRVALLGTDSAVGKRTTAWILVDGLGAAGCSAELIGTGQTAWMQGARYGIVLDSLVNDFVSGEIEHAIWSCWNEQCPEVMVLEGQGSLMNPAYPGGMELLAAGRPQIVILQHAPARKHYDGFPGHEIHPIARQVQAIEMLSGRPVVAVTVNHEGLAVHQTRDTCRRIERSTGKPTFDVLFDGPSALIDVVRPYLSRAKA